ncbi:hypothetical protein yinte0001_13330 [Yersinia intermedia ATCC 29909]|nr:hypothetical protein yinte0001_13330 [Yersinia intermedia ATCC 29909]
MLLRRQKITFFYDKNNCWARRFVFIFVRINCSTKLSGVAKGQRRESFSAD